MFKQLKLKSYLAVVFTILLFLSGLITLFSIFGMLQNKTNLNDLINRAIAADMAVKTCQIKANNAARDVREMALAKNRSKYEQYKNRINKSIEAIKEQIDIFKNTYGEEDGLAAKYEKAFNNWFPIAQNAISLAELGKKEKAADVLLEHCSPALNEIDSIVDEINTKTELLKSTTIAKNERFINFAILFILSFFFISLIISLSFAGKTTKDIVAIVNRIKAGIQELSKGNLKTHISYEADNEFGELSKVMDFSFDELAKYINVIDFAMTEFSKGNFTCQCPITFLGDFAHIQKSIEDFQAKMNDTLLDIETASTQVNIGAEQVSQSMQDLASGATEQAGSVQELSATIINVSNQIEQSSEYANEANILGMKARKTVSKSKEEMEHLLTAIKSIALVSEGINDIIKTIDSIASQTNLLALNAAIEAASAGNAGKGFAVVADEIRKLSQESANAAKNITELIQNSLNHIKQGELLANRTNKTFEEVADNAKLILEMVEKIAQTAKEQSCSVYQISQGIDEISSVIQTNCASSEECSAAGEELTKQSIMMKEEIDKFQLMRPIY